MIDGFGTDEKVVDEDKTGMLVEKSGRKNPGSRHTRTERR
jgi:hypothetical protein